MKVNWDDECNPIYGKIKNVPNHQPVLQLRSAYQLITGDLVFLSQKRTVSTRNPYTKSPKWFQNSKVYRCSPHLHCDSCLLHRWISVFSNMLSNNRPWNFTITRGIAAAIRVDCLTLWEISHRNVRLNGMVHRAVNFNNMMIYHVLSIFGMAISGFGIYSLLFGESTWKIFGSVHTRKSGWYVTDSLVSPWSPSVRSCRLPWSGTSKQSSSGCRTGGGSLWHYGDV